MAEAVAHRDGEIERLQSIIRTLQRVQFGRRSERSMPINWALAFEADIGRVEESATTVIEPVPDAQPKRRSLPAHLPREEIRFEPATDVCSCCGGALHPVGESISEMLDWVPTQLQYACRTCNRIVQAPAPERPIAGGLASPAQVLTAKPHAPLLAVADDRTDAGDRHEAPAELALQGDRHHQPVQRQVFRPGRGARLERRRHRRRSQPPSFGR